MGHCCTCLLHLTLVLILSGFFGELMLLIHCMILFNAYLLNHEFKQCLHVTRLIRIFIAGGTF